MNHAASKAPLSRNDLVRSVLMLLYFFLTIATFWVVKPLKKSLFLRHYEQDGLELFGRHLGAAEIELLAKELNVVVAFFAMIAFVTLSKHLRRAKLSVVLALGCAATFLALAGLLVEPSAATVWGFYLYGDLYSTLMVAGFFAFLNDSVDGETAKRTYGLVGLGGVLGGVFGSIFLASLLDYLTLQHWMFVSAGATAAIILFALGAEHFTPPRKSAAAPVITAQPARSAARLVFGSRYLLAILGIVSIYEVVSTVMDFQFSFTITHLLSGDAIGRQFANVYVLTNTVSLLVQVFLTTPIMRYRGVTAALLVLPLVAGGASLVFALLPLLWTGSLLNTADNALSYSIQQSAREALYVPRPAEEKYPAKAFIDMFGQRVAKGIGVLLSLLFAQVFTGMTAVRSLSLVTVALVVVWVGLARYAGRRFHDALAEPATTPDGR